MIESKEIKKANSVEAVIESMLVSRRRSYVETLESGNRDRDKDRGIQRNTEIKW